MRDYLLLYINGKEHRISGEQAFMPLSSYLRCDQGAIGTKVVCEEGDCGACSVLLGRQIRNGAKREFSYRAVNSCIQFMYQLDCSHIVTIEGLKLGDELNPVQQAMVECHGTQCGYCTPGFIVTMCSMFDRRPPLNQQDVKDGLTGNLCRCTGYEPIIKAALEVNPQKVAKIAELYPSKEMEASFAKARQQSAIVKSEEHTLLLPATLLDALKFRKEYPDSVIVSGGTDICVYWNKRSWEPKTLLSVANLDELLELKADAHMMSVGARVSLAEIEEFVQTKIPELANVLWLFGSPQIRNAGTLAGNIANGSPIADSLPFLFVMDAEIELTSLTNKRRVNINQFYTGYKQIDLKSDEMITNIFVPIPQSDERVKLYKVSKRKHLDISAFTAAFRLKLNGDAIESIAIAYGGVAATVVRLPRTEEFLKGKKFNLDTLVLAGEKAKTEITPISDVRGSSDFRLTLAGNIPQKLYFDLTQRELASCPQ